ncbi:MAG TPA: molybdopterin-dependent oxidoreductase [Sporichthyaceae bacterium]|nr:molybdopterin-dependent oxidoreductase [Sporichthyaceae bacterium]
MTAFELGSKTTVRGACPHDCPDTCAMVIDVVDGRVTGVRGDAEHPYTRGGLCAKVNDYEKHAYHPDRLLYPMRRTGPKGSGEFTRISWDEAIAEICTRFTDIRETFGGEAILPLSYLGNMGILNGLNVMDPFMHRLGASVCERAFCTSCRSAAFVMTNGPSFIDPESLAHSKLIILWGHNMVSSNLHLWPFVREAQRKGAKVVVIDPYRTRTAARADWHIKIRPGTDGALALAMMHVIINEGLTDDEYIANHTEGFSELKGRVASFDPERVEGITGVPAEDIRVLAREFATAQPSAIRVGVAIENHPQGGQAFRAIFSLPALVGSWRHPGGGIVEISLYAFPVRWEFLSQTDWIAPGTRVVPALQVGRALTGELGLDPPIKALMVCNANPVITVPEQNKVLAGLAREDLFTVVSEQFMTDTARYADILLPATTSLEHVDLMFSWGHLYVTMNNRAIPPIGEALPNIDLFRRLAAGMGFDDPWFSLTDDQVLQQSLDWDAPQLAGITLDRLKQEGWVKLTYPDADSFAPYADGGFATATGRVALQMSGDDFVLPVFRQGYTELQGNTRIDPLPDYLDEPAVPGYPLRMVTPKAHSFLNSQYSNMTRQGRSEGDQHVQIHPAAAQQRQISDGQKVVVFNEHGTFEAVAKVSDAVFSDAVIAPYGYWVSNVGPTTAAVTPDDQTDIGRGAIYSHVAVEVRPA